MAVVYTGGTFDLFHEGHVNLLRECWREADNGADGDTRVVVALNTDRFIEQYKGSRPVMSYDERRAVILSCRYVDEVVPNDSGADSTPTIKRVKPHKIVIGSDWRDKDYFKQMGFDQGWLDSNDIRLVYVPYTRHISSTELKQRINDL